MNPTLFLRIASFLSLVHAVLHTVGGVFGSPRHGAEEVAVLDNMRAHRFDVMGSMRTYWDFLFGYGLFVTIGLVVQAILFWQLSTLAKTNPSVARPIVALFFFNCVAVAIVSGKYFFIGPAATQSLIALCLGLAFVAALVRAH